MHVLFIYENKSVYSKFFFQSKCRYLSCSLKCYPLFFYVITPNMSQRFVFVITKAKKKMQNNSSPTLCQT